MTEFWIDVLLSILVTIASVIASWLANRLVSSTKRLAVIRRVIEQSVSEGAKIREIKKELERYYTAQESALIWGSDLALIAFSMDLAILGIWVSNPAFFPFFSRWNSPGVSREIPVWLILLFFHFVLLLVSIALKHLQSETIETRLAGGQVRFLHREWFKQKRLMLASNTVGFMSLLSSFVVITNSI